jgi:ATP-binding cassette subfamily F protein 3
MITFDNLSKHYGGATLFENVATSFHENERTGLVGVNGSGKTTLLRMLCGEESADKGEIRKPSGMTIGYLPQEIELLDAKTPIEIVLEPFSHLLDYEEKIERLAGRAGDDSDKGDHALQEIGALHDALEFHDVYSLTARAEAILGGLGVPKVNWRQPIVTLSGGYRMRTVLGKLLLQSPDFLLLDEPTNHLDMDSLVWLEKFLSRYKGGMLMVSHDRDFLNRMIGYTAEIRNRTITVFKGNYDEYIRLREQYEIAAESRSRNLGLQIAQKERFVERFKAKNTKATAAQSRIKQIEKLKELLPETVSDTKTIDFSFPQPAPSGSLPLKFRNVVMSYGGAAPVFSGLSLDVNRGDKIAIVGPNGSGKSTILKLMAAHFPPSQGTVELGYNTIVRYFGQHQLEQLDSERTCYETVVASSVNTEKTFVRNILGAFLFSGDSVDKKVRVLSGGEKSRLVLATILASPGNTLLLDEPTNHLDIDSVGMLSNALAEFAGTIVVVSHDDYFVSKIATRIIEMRPGMVRDFPGKLADYRAYVEEGLWGSGQEATSSKKTVIGSKEASEKELRIRQREQKKLLQRAVEKLEREIAAREQEVGQLRHMLDDPAHALNHVMLHETSTKIEAQNRELEKLLEEWEQRHTELEALGEE